MERTRLIIVCAIWIVCFFTVSAAYSDRQALLEESFDIVETFDRLQDWSPSIVPNGRTTLDLPKLSNGAKSMWGLWDYWSSSPLENTPWIADHGNFSWEGKSLRMDLEPGASAKSGPSRFGLYFGTNIPDGVDAYSDSGVVTSGYRKDVYVFYMVKFPPNAFSVDSSGFKYFGYYKFNTLSVGFSSPVVAVEGSAAYGAANIHPHFQTGASYDGHMRITHRYASDANWPGVTKYSTVPRVDDVNLDVYLLNTEWFGVEFHVHRGTPGVADGYQEYWIYDSSGGAKYSGRSQLSMMVPEGKDWGFNRFWFGGNLDFDTSSLDSTYYIDDFIVDGNRIGPRYFSIISSVRSVEPPSSLKADTVQ